MNIHQFLPFYLGKEVALGSTISNNDDELDGYPDEILQAGTIWTLRAIDTDEEVECPYTLTKKVADETFVLNVGGDIRPVTRKLTGMSVEEFRFLFESGATNEFANRNIFDMESQAGLMRILGYYGRHSTIAELLGMSFDIFWLQYHGLSVDKKRIG